MSEDEENNKRVVGKPWKPGQSGNPAGSPKLRLYKNGVLQSRENLKKYLSKYGKKAARRLVKLLDSDDERIALGAAKLLFERAYGKETTRIEVDGEINHSYTQILDEVAQRLNEKNVKKIPSPREINKVSDVHYEDVTPILDDKGKKGE